MQGYSNQRLENHDVRGTVSEATDNISHQMTLTWSGNHFFHVGLENLVSAPDIRQRDGDHPIKSSWSYKCPESHQKRRV